MCSLRGLPCAQSFQEAAQSPWQPGRHLPTSEQVAALLVSVLLFPCFQFFPSFSSPLIPYFFLTQEDFFFWREVID